MKRNRSRKSRNRSLDNYDENGELWGIYCLSENGRWILQGLRRSKDEAMKILEKMLAKGKRCRVVLARF